MTRQQYNLLFDCAIGLYLFCIFMMASYRMYKIIKYTQPGQENSAEIPIIPRILALRFNYKVDEDNYASGSLHIILL